MSDFAEYCDYLSACAGLLLPAATAATMPAATLPACSPKARLSTGSAFILIFNALLQVARRGAGAKKAKTLLATCSSRSTDKEEARITQSNKR
eukprot:17570-Heterococcus_DN1.PRE.3